VKAALERLEQVAKTDNNTVPAILECVESYCTLGEISQVFRGVFGEQDGAQSF
jgi:methylmalonyl-CoA mutase N-terminal domain/subunit